MAPTPSLLLLLPINLIRACRCQAFSSMSSIFWLARACYCNYRHEYWIFRLAERVTSAFKMYIVEDFITVSIDTEIGFGNVWISNECFIGLHFALYLLYSLCICNNYATYIAWNGWLWSDLDWMLWRWMVWTIWNAVNGEWLVYTMQLLADFECNGLQFKIWFMIGL